MTDLNKVLDALEKTIEVNNVIEEPLPAADKNRIIYCVPNATLEHLQDVRRAVIAQWAKVIAGPQYAWKLLIAGPLIGLLSSYTGRLEIKSFPTTMWDRDRIDELGMNSVVLTSDRCLAIRGARVYSEHNTNPGLGATVETLLAMWDIPFVPITRDFEPLQMLRRKRTFLIMQEAVRKSLEKFKLPSAPIPFEKMQWVLEEVFRYLESSGLVYDVSISRTVGPRHQFTSCPPNFTFTLSWVVPGETEFSPTEIEINCLS